MTKSRRTMDGFGMGLHVQSLVQPAWKNVLCCSCWSDNGYQQFTLVVYLTQHRVTETTENSQTTNKNAHCRLEFAERNREFPHKQQFVHCYLGNSCIFSYSCYHFPYRIQITDKLKTLKWHFLTSHQRTICTQFGGKEKVVLQEQNTTEEFCFKGELQIILFYNFQRVWYVQY